MFKRLQQGSCFASYKITTQKEAIYDWTGLAPDVTETCNYVREEPSFWSHSLLAQKQGLTI